MCDGKYDAAVQAGFALEPSRLAIIAQDRPYVLEGAVNAEPYMSNLKNSYSNMLGFPPTWGRWV